MTPETQHRWQALRRKQAKTILAEPHLFKACYYCFSISKIACGLCPLCHGYRWDSTLETLIGVANTIASTPFPLTAGTVPRFADQGLNYFTTKHIKGAR